MDNTKPQLNPVQEQYLQETLERASAFEETIRTRGWEHIKAYYTNLVQKLANDLMVSNEPITKFEDQRNEVKGLRKLLAMIDGDLKTLENERNKDKA